MLDYERDVLFCGQRNYEPEVRELVTTWRSCPEMWIEEWMVVDFD